MRRADATRSTPSWAPFTREPPSAPLRGRRALIDRCFRLDSVEAIVAALSREDDAFADSALALLRTRSPTSLKISLTALRAAQGLDRLEDCLRLEFRLVCQVLDGVDFYEGVRAAVIDKDRAPRWNPGRIEDVPDTFVRAYLDPRDSPEVSFVSRPGVAPDG